MAQPYLSLEDPEERTMRTEKERKDGKDSKTERVRKEDGERDGKRDRAASAMERDAM